MKMLDNYGPELLGKPKDFIEDNLVPVGVWEVGEWVFEHSNKDKWDSDKDIPCHIPPFTHTWYEYRGPDRDFTVGVLSQRIRFDVDTLGESEKDALKAMNTLACAAYEAANEGEGEKASYKDGPLSQVPVFNVEYRMFIQADGYSPMKAACFYDALDAQGSLLSDGLCSMPEDLANYTTSFAGDVVEGLMYYLVPVRFANSLMHCKNTELVDIPIPKKVRENRKKKGRHPGVEYKTLKIDPMQKQIRREQLEGESEVDRALHICRGHFKDYRENGLFGRDSHKGIYWWEQHARGSKEHGEIRKDYEVQAA